MGLRAPTPRTPRWRRVMIMLSSVALMLGLAASPAAAQAQPTPSHQAVRVLVFHGPDAMQDDPVAKAATAIKALGAQHGFSADVYTDPAVFTAENLAQYRGVVFLSANGVTLTADEETAFRAFIENGGGFVGVHDAARAQADSSWFTDLIGTRPAASASGDPETQVQRATVDLTDRQSPANRGLPLTITRSDQWMNWNPNPQGQVETVAQVEEWTYNPGSTGNGPFHPITWCRDYDGGRSFYTGMGRTDASYTSDRQFRSHLLGGIEWAAGMVRGDCQATIASNYTVQKLAGQSTDLTLDQIGEPHGLTIAPDGKVFYIGKAACAGNAVPQPNDWTNPDIGKGCGTIHQWDPKTNQVKHLTTLDVMGNRGSGDELVKDEEGLVGITLDPKFEQNGWIYVYWMPHESIDRDTEFGNRTVSRFTYNASTQTIDQSTRKDLLKWPTQIHSCCHAGGGMAFDDHGNLYVGFGDNNSSLGAGLGYSGNNWTQDYKGVSFQDARRTAGNTDNLNGKILRIHPEADGTYTIPKGNLFPPGTPKTRPEIYVMGVRNIARIAWDPVNKWLTAGWVGPDANVPDEIWGEAKYETATIINSPGNQGWPYCMGNKQPYRDRSNVDATQPAGWYDCNHLQNNSPRNTGLVNLPPARNNMIWYSPQGGGPVYPTRTDGSGLPTYKLGDEKFTEPYFKGGSQAIMDGPTYHRSQVNVHSGVAWPAYWDNKWFIGDESESRNRVAVTVDPKTVASAGRPAFGEDLSSIIQPGGGDDHVQAWMDAKFGPDGALYMLDYGSGFFTLDPNQKLIRITYHGGPATPNPSQVVARAVQQSAPKTVVFNSTKAGGVSWKWDFGDGTTSTEANPTHTYANFGTYHAKLTVTYANGEVATAGVNATAG